MSTPNTHKGTPRSDAHKAANVRELTLRYREAKEAARKADLKANGAMARAYQRDAAHVGDSALLADRAGAESHRAICAELLMEAHGIDVKVKRLPKVPEQVEEVANV